MKDSDGLDVDERSVIRLRVTVEAAAYPSVVNTASVTSPAEDTDPSNNTAEDPADGTRRVALTIDKTLSSISPSTAKYQITVATTDRTTQCRMSSWSTGCLGS